MKTWSLLLNLPWSILCLVGGLLSLPYKVEFISEQAVVVLHVSSFWWYCWLPGMKNIRAMAMGNVVLLGPHVHKTDLQHELIHIRQYQEKPFVHFFLYIFELWRKGYNLNKYEIEAYRKTDSK